MKFVFELMGRNFRTVAIIATVLFFVAYSEQGKIRGRVIKVIDGDTVVVQGLIWKRHIRMTHIDAPEKHQSFGDVSSERLHEKLNNNFVCVVLDKKQNDPHKRCLGEIFVGSRNINLEMVNEGLAWHYKRYSKSKEYAEAEERARKTKLGLWRERNPIPPERFRHLRHSGMAA